MKHHIPANWNLEFVIYLFIKAVKSGRVGLGGNTYHRIAFNGRMHSCSII
jgi:hypothetical protein